MQYGDVVQITAKGQVVNALVARSAEIAPHNPADGQPKTDSAGKALAAQEHLDLIYLDPEAKDQKGGPIMKVREMRHVAATAVLSSQLSVLSDKPEDEQTEDAGIGKAVAVALLLIGFLLIPLTAMAQVRFAWATEYATSNLMTQQPNT